MSDSKSHEKISPFMEIAASLVQQLLSDVDKIGDVLSTTMLDIEEKKHEYRSQLMNERFVLDDSGLDSSQTYTVCGIDGSCAVERLVGTDLLIAGAIGVDGLTANENPNWIVPDHTTFVNAEAHDSENMNVARALMLEMELRLATEAPHDLILMDGSLTTAFIHMYKAVDQFQSGVGTGHNKLKEDYYNYLRSYKKILICDDKAILSLVLKAGEFTRPILYAHNDA